MIWFVVTSADGQEQSVRADSPEEALMTRREAHADGVARRIQRVFDGPFANGEAERWLRATILAAIDGRPEGVREAPQQTASVDDLYGGDVRTMPIPSGSHADLDYQVTLYGTAGATCECAGYLGHHKDCRHIRAARARQRV